jgi:hypothetical protein
LIIIKDETVPEAAATEAVQLESSVKEFLESKKSPLSSHTKLILEQKHWKLLIGISAIESQYCKRQLGNNCWGITKLSGGYRAYATLDEAIVDANNLIERRQKQGRWLTVDSMNGSYVVPKNQNWVNVVNKNIIQLEIYERSPRTIHQ